MRGSVGRKATRQAAFMSLALVLATGCAGAIEEPAALDTDLPPDAPAFEPADAGALAQSRTTTGTTPRSNAPVATTPAETNRADEVQPLPTTPSDPKQPEPSQRVEAEEPSQREPESTSQPLETEPSEPTRPAPSGTSPAEPTVPQPAPVPSADLPPQLCASPLGPVDTSRPTTVVGTGTPASCTETALREAVAKGGIITFNCGSATTTIPITQTLVAPTDRDTTIDGQHAIVLDGRGAVQILRAHHEDFRVNDRVLTVQRLAMINGRDAGSDFLARDGEKSCAWGYHHGGGGAIYARDINVHVWGVRFEGNRGPELGPDVAGGAIYVMGAKKLRVASSTFRNNSASNGGAIGALHTASELYNVVLEHNRASGMLANFANASGCPTFNHEAQGGAGGLGGAFYSDGFDPGDMFCGVRMSDNVSGDLGGAVFRSAYWGLVPETARQTITWEKSTFERNRSPVGGGGAAYVNNSLFTVKGCTFADNDAGSSDGGALKITGATVRFDDVQVARNKSVWGGGIAHWGAGLEGVGSTTSMRWSSNAPNDYVGDFPSN